MDPIEKTILFGLCLLFMNKEENKISANNAKAYKIKIYNNCAKIKILSHIAECLNK